MMAVKRWDVSSTEIVLIEVHSVKRTNSHFDVAPQVKPGDIHLRKMRSDEGYADDRKNDDDDCEGEDANKSKHLCPGNADVPKHQDRDSDDCQGLRGRNVRGGYNILTHYICHNIDCTIAMKSHPLESHSISPRDWSCIR